MSSLVSDMADALISAGFASSKGIDVFAWQIQASPTAQLMVLLTGGEPPIETVDSQTAKPGIQVYVVDSDLAAAETKAEAIRAYFRLQKNLIGQVIKAARSSPIYLGQLDDGRHKFVVEFKIFS